MALKYAAQGIVDVDGQEVEMTKFDVKTTTGRKSVKTMNRKARVKGYAKGVVEYTLSITVAVPLDEPEPDWVEVDDAKVSIELENGKRESYLGCFSTDVGDSYSVDNELVRDIQMVALDKVVE